jgi:hypothetical protein
MVRGGPGPGRKGGDADGPGDRVALWREDIKRRGNLTEQMRQMSRERPGTGDRRVNEQTKKGLKWAVFQEYCYLTRVIFF